ncbi:MAG: hypothetical protein R2804_08305 [Cyclobacteriaceae bacterium]
MSIHSKHPKYLAFVKNELRTLNFISSNASVTNKYKNLSVISKSTYEKYSNARDNVLATHDFEFGAYFDIEIEGTTRRIIVECVIKSKFDIATYVLAICKGTLTRNTVLRKFHFDYALPRNGDRNPKPVYHMQYGGKQSPQLGALNLSVDHLNPWFSSPRLTFVPMNLALLIDLIFCEFRSTDTVKIIEDPRWREHIKLNEEFLLKPYFCTLNGFLNNGHKEKYLIRDYNYGK